MRRRGQPLLLRKPYPQRNRKRRLNPPLRHRPLPALLVRPQRLNRVHHLLPGPGAKRRRRHRHQIRLLLLVRKRRVKLKAQLGVQLLNRQPGLTRVPELHKRKVPALLLCLVHVHNGSVRPAKFPQPGLRQVARVLQPNANRRRFAEPHLTSSSGGGRRQRSRLLPIVQIRSRPGVVPVQFRIAVVLAHLVQLGVQRGQIQRVGF
uniref:(northern house mosquito) hypothetical protein n=1 Tax=Culex pipiens TaxID=7175 RepID=A0A8D8B943_CULPI